MTENEAKRPKVAIIGSGKSVGRTLKAHIDLFEELESYRAIGTVEEFKDLKENQCKCEDCAGCTNWNCDCYNERAKAIDEFAERMSIELTDRSFEAMDASEFVLDVVSHDKMQEVVMEVAEQLKGGAENG